MWPLQAIGATPWAANAGVHALVKNLAIELASDKIRVNSIALAVIEYARVTGRSLRLNRCALRRRDSMRCTASATPSAPPRSKE